MNTDLKRLCKAAERGSQKIFVLEGEEIISGSAEAIVRAVLMELREWDEEEVIRMCDHILAGPTEA